MDVVLFGKNHGNHGPTRVTRGLAKGLSTLDHDVKMITYGDRSDPPNSDIKIESFQLPGQSVTSWRRLYSNVRDLVDSSEYDVFHALERYPHRSDIRTVQWTADSYIVWRRAKRQSLNVRSIAGEAILNWMSRSGATKADSVIASSPETKRQMVSLWFLSPDEIIPPGIDPTYRSKSIASESKPRVLFVGRFEERKGYDRILPYLNPSDEKFDVRIIGGIADEGYAQRSLAGGWKSCYLGYVDNSELEEEYESADIVVIPSYLENFSMVALEAISKGCIVIISQDCGFAQFEWANPAHGIYVVDSGQEAANKLRSVVQDVTIEEKKNAAFQLSSRFTWESISERYISKYEDVIKTRERKV